jgi:DNA-binding XRE family transcriptional regulator
MIGSAQSVELLGRRYVLLEEEQYERLRRDAAQGAAVAEEDLPQFPDPAASGRLPAVECARVALARDLILARKRAGLSQEQLAQLAGIRQETVSRLETGKHTANPRTVDKIMAAVESRRRKRRRASGQGR